MASTYTQISIHTVFAVKNRENFITEPWRDRLHEYISGIVKSQECKSLAVGGWKDHVHVFYGLNPSKSISETIRIIKGSSSKWINEQGFVRGKFSWQDSYGAFSYSKSQRDSVIKYIMNQEEHHNNQTFREEYLNMLNKFEVDYNEAYLFDFYD